jgi:hypothetical protein
MIVNGQILSDYRRSDEFESFIKIWLTHRSLENEARQVGHPGRCHPERSEMSSALVEDCGASSEINSMSGLSSRVALCIVPLTW